MKRIVKISLVAFVVLAFTAPGAWAFGKARSIPVKDVIVLVPDGCSQSVQTAARWYKKHVLEDDEPLALDMMGTTGMVKTYMANSVITGSAAAATAFATGYKTTVRFLSVGPDPAKECHLTGFNSPIPPYAPIQTVLEGAKMARKMTGLVSTSRITHATPAAYACHIDDRSKDN